VVICLERGADLHMVQRIPLPLTVSCFSKIQIGLPFLIPDDPGGPGQRAVKRVCVKRTFRSTSFNYLAHSGFRPRWAMRSAAVSFLTVYVRPII